MKMVNASNTNGNVQFMWFFFLSKSSCIFSLNERKSVDYVVANEIYLFQEDFCVTLQRSGTGEVKERRDIRKNSVLIKSHVRIPKYFMFE